MLAKLLNYLISAALIMLCLWAGNGIQDFFGLSVPGSVFGMILLFLLLATGIVKVQWVEASSQLLIRYMIILFVPISVGLMTHFGTLIDNAIPIFAASVGASIIVLVVLALILDRVLKEK